MSRSLPCRQVKRIHEGTPTYILRRGACALAPHAAGYGNHGSTFDRVAGLFFRDDRRQRGIARRAAAGCQTEISRFQVEKEAWANARRPASPRGEYRNRASELRSAARGILRELGSQQPRFTQKTLQRHRPSDSRAVT